MVDVAIVEKHIRAPGEVRAPLIVIVIVESAMVDHNKGGILKVRAESVGVEKRGFNDTGLCASSSETYGVMAKLTLGNITLVGVCAVDSFSGHVDATVL